MKYYRHVPACGRYQAYVFELTTLKPEDYVQLKAFIQTLGEQRYPQSLPVMRIKHRAFFIDFPAYGFPYFKVSFYRHSTQTLIEAQLKLINDFLNHINNNN